MKQLILIFSLLVACSVTAQEKDSLSQAEKERREQNIQAGNPFKKYGYTPKIATLSKGKYLEWHDLDSIVIIGSVYYNTKSKKIIDFVERDMTNPDAQPLSDIRGRWISPDPLTEEFPSWSPYAFVYNNPVKFNDPTGMAPECPKCPVETYIPLAEGSYTDNVGDKSGGWTAIRVDKLGDKGFRGVLYEGTYDGNTEYIYATAGTNDMVDVVDDLTQLSGDSNQYDLSVTLAQGVSENYEGASFTGHSLGGGLQVQMLWQLKVKR